MTDEQREYIITILLEHKIGYASRFGSEIYVDGERFDVFLFGYYRYMEPCATFINAGATSSTTVSINEGKLIEYDGINSFEKLKGSVPSYLKRNKESFLYWWKMDNERQHKYRKIWRKWKNRWYKRISYKSISPIIYYEWQSTDPWFYTKDDIKFIKEHNFDLPDGSEANRETLRKYFASESDH